ncbi:MAG TPA: Glu/Leu/Phe/Val dehydrogenase dimerization domain-containing protein, partial [Thermoanaerobaculia bacterium]|nr:Glu/Leu/Phe/Val dehydrogenase dimerization domain-containing protein [Thermoanaerobaculia bacterium]
MPDTTAPQDLESVLRDWDGEAVLSRFDRETGAWIFIALHSTALGPALGGTRMRVYPTPADGLRDAQRLAESMTMKWAT